MSTSVALAPPDAPSKAQKARVLINEFIGVVSGVWLVGSLINPGFLGGWIFAA
jgi:hypothetical protein